MFRNLLDTLFRPMTRSRLRRRVPPDLRAGDVCSVVRDARSYAIAKVLVVETHTIHVRVYKEAFARRPERIETAALDLGSINDPDGCGIGHLPLSCEAFGALAPLRIHREEVAEAELEGYRIWQESGGDAWG